MDYRKKVGVKLELVKLQIICYTANNPLKVRRGKHGGVQLRMERIMSDSSEQTAEYRLRQLMYGDANLRIMEIADEVLETHDGLAECFQALSRHQRFIIGLQISNDRELHSLPDDCLKERIKRRLEVDYAQFTGDHHFTNAATECFNTYCSGFFIACTMMSHSINEGIINFVAERNNIKRYEKEELPETIEKLACLEILTPNAAEASKAIWCSYRNAIHHMRGDITKIKDWHKLATKNLRNLVTVECCVFGYELVDGGMLLHFPQHWDDDGKNQIRVRQRFKQALKPIY